MDLMLNAEEYIVELITNYGSLIYLILFSIIFIETGLVVFTFFPADALLFTAGIMAASGELNFPSLPLLLSIATILGNTSNFLIGNYLGRNFFKKERARRSHYIERSFIYFEKNRIKAIVVSRFFPFLRSFVPFVAGISSMNIRSFTIYNVLGGVLWIAAYLLLGFFFGAILWVKANFGLIFFGIFIFLILGIAVGLLRPVIYTLFKK